MKKIFTILLLCAQMLAGTAAAENISLYTATRISIKQNTAVFISGNLVHKGDRQDDYNIFNAGEIHLHGDIQNKGGNLFKASTNSINSNGIATQGTVFFSGKTGGIIYSNSGDTIYFANMKIEKSVFLGCSIHVQGNMALQNQNVYLNKNNIYLFYKNDAKDVRNTGQILGENNIAQVTGNGVVYAVKRAGQWDELAPLGFVSGNKNNGSIYISRYNSEYAALRDESMSGYFKVKTTIDNNSPSELSLRSFKNHSNKEIASVYSLNTPSVKRHVSYDKAQYFTSTKEANFIADTYGIFAIVSKCSNPPKIDMGDDIHICEGQDTLLTAQIAGGSGRLFYFWNEETASVLNSRRVWAAGTYTLKVIDEKGCVGTDTIKVSTHSYPSPKISKSADLLCEDEILQLVYSDTIPDCSVVWNFGDGTNDTVGALACSDTIFKTYPVACAAYTITLTATTRYACTAQTQTYIRTETVPQAGMLLNFLTDTIADISAVINNVCNNMIEYKWFVNGNLTSTQNNFRYHFPERKIYNISMEIASRKCSMSLDSTIEIKERAHLSFASNKRKFCEGDEIILKNTTEINYGDFMFYWKFSDGKNYTTADIADGVNRIMEKAGMYVISLTGESGGWIRTVTDTIWVYENPVVQFPDSIFTCSNNYVLFVENSIYDQYVWTDENDFYLGAYSLYIVDKNGRYKLTQTNAHGCTASDSTVAILNERIKVELGQDLIACDSITLDAGYLSEKCIWKNYAENGMGYSDTGRFYTVKESGKIVLRVEGDSTCFGTDSINISIYKKPNASLGIDTFYCSSDSVLLCIPDNEEGVSIKWNDNVNVGERWIKNRGIYSVVVSDFSGYCTDSSSVFVEEKQSPVLSIPDVVFACNGDTVTLEMWDNILAERIAWTMPDGRQTEGVVFETNEEGSYVVTVKYANGCSTSGVWNVHRQSTSAVSSFLMASEAMLGDSVFLINLSYPAPLEYIWEATNGFNSREENPVCNFYREGIYAVTLGAANNECVVSKTKQIQIGKGGDLISESSGDTVIIEDKLDDVSKIKMTGDEIICKVAPNPSKNIFKVEVENGDTYDVITSLGKNVCSGKISSKIFVINAENWRAGIYLLHIKRGKMSKVIKLIKV